MNVQNLTPNVQHSNPSVPYEVLYILTHCGRVTQICVYALQLCEDGCRTSAFLTRAWFPRTIHFNYVIYAAFLRMALLTDVYRNVTSLRSNDL